MGESKRRRKLDPNYGNKSNFANLSGSRKKSQKSSNLDRFNRMNQYDDTIENSIEEDVLDELEYEDDNFDVEDEDKNMTRLVVKYQYEAQGKTPDGKSVSQSGEAEFVRQVGEDQFDDDGIIFGEAFQSTMEHFYIFGFEKQGHIEVSEVTLSIKNLEINN